MTYMYEHPKYINMKLPEEVNKTFPKYRLLAYGEGEGKNIDKLRAEKFDGIPVLFIPGNSGSHKQVRSLASVALRKAIEDSDGQWRPGMVEPTIFGRAELSQSGSKPDLLEPS
jgi:hypothetical protein